MPMGKISLREVFSRPTRALLTFSSIVIGVAAVVSVFLTTSNTRRAQREMLRAVSGKADLEVVANGERGFPYDTLKIARQTEGVNKAAASINRWATIFAGEKRAKARVLGIDPKVDQEVRDYKVVEGRGLESRSEVLVDRSFARSLDIQVDDTIKLLARASLVPTRLQVVGMVEPSGGSGVAVGTSLYALIPDAARWFDTRNSIDQIQIVLDAEAVDSEVAHRLQQVLPPEVSVRLPATHSQMAEETIFATQNGLHMSIAFVLLIALFIIYNTFQMSVGERRKQLGVLRAIGTTRSQIKWMILREALVMSMIASALGCGLGIYGATWLSRASQQVLQVHLPSIQLSIWPFVIAVAFGMGVSLLGAYLPANRASSVQPLEAIRSIDTGQDEMLVRIATPIAVLSLFAGSIILWFAVRGKLPIGGDVVGIVMMLLSVVLFIPVTLPWVSTWIMKILRPWLGAPAMLAQRQLTRHLGRSTLTIGVLFVAVGTSIGMAGNVLDNVENVRRWYTQAMKGDFFVRASEPDISSGASADLPLGTEEEVRQIVGTKTITALSTQTAFSGEDSLLIVARDFHEISEGLFEIPESQRETVRKNLTRGQVVIGSVLSQRKNIQAGGVVQMETSTGTTNFDVAAVVNDYLGGGLTVYMDSRVARLAFGMEGADVLVIRAEEGGQEVLERELRAYCAERGLILQSYSEVIGIIHGMVNGVIASLWTLLALCCTIAALGLVNTLTMNILEQTREIGMLRVVAMTRRQTRRMILAQALMMGFLGIVPGAIVGVFVSYAISLSAQAILGHNILFELHPWLVLGAVVLGMAIVLVASLIPAERAARLKLSAALQYE